VDYSNSVLLRHRRRSDACQLRWMGVLNKTHPCQQGPSGILEPNPAPKALVNRRIAHFAPFSPFREPDRRSRPPGRCCQPVRRADPGQAGWRIWVVLFVTSQGRRCRPQPGPHPMTPVAPRADQRPSWAHAGAVVDLARGARSKRKCLCGPKRRHGSGQPVNIRTSRCWSVGYVRGGLAHSVRTDMRACRTRMVSPGMARPRNSQRLIL
jgi:hypothetical protein